MKELDKIAPKLSKMKKEHPFGVPDHYFDDFSARLQTKLETEKSVLPKPKNKVIRLLKPAIGLAASFLVIFMLVYWPIKSFLPEYMAKNNDTETISNEDVDPYRAIIERVDENTFFALIEESDEETSQEVSLNDDDLMNYISSNMSEYDIYLETDY